MALTSEQLAASPRERDAARLSGEIFPYHELVALVPKREPRYQVAILQSVLDDIHAHGQATSEVEVCGVLLGNVYRDSKGPWCLIDASVRGNYSSGKQTQVTITSETWTHVNEVRDRKFPDKKFVGWYHTHPGFGIFLSGMDDFIQANWFGEPWQIALVYDPKSAEEGIFVWREGKNVNEPFLIVPDNGATATMAGEQSPASSPDAKLPSGTLGDLMSRLQATEQRQRWIFILLCVVAFIALAWPPVMYLYMSNDGTIHPTAQPVESGVHDPNALPSAVRPLKLDTPKDGN
jgi:proteasome lid subunit RPN8/RPN11